MEFTVNNGRKICLIQTEPDGVVNVLTIAEDLHPEKEVDYDYQITPGDFVMMLNWYKYQKENGNPDLNY